MKQITEHKMRLMKVALKAGGGGLLNGARPAANRVGGSDKGVGRLSSDE